MKSPPPISRSISRRAALAFTLVEMLVVMTIMAILLAVTIPALRGINGTGSRKSAVRTMMGVLDQARMLAISDGRATYVVFAGLTLDGLGKVQPSMIGRAYAIYEDTGNFAPVQKSAWQILPVGVAFKVSDGTGWFGSTPTNTSSITNRALTTPQANQAFPVAPQVNTNTVSTPTLRLPYIKFDPTGAIDGSIADAKSLYWRILVFQGVVKADGTDVATRSVSKSSNNGTTAEMLLLDEIRINTATGRARYTMDPADNLTVTNA